MRKNSIRRTVLIRAAAALVSILLFSFVTTFNIMRIQSVQTKTTAAEALLQRAQAAEAAHYKWASGLSSALYAGTEFTGSTDPTTCVLGKWLYGTEISNDLQDQEVRNLYKLIEPLHKEIHESAVHVLGLSSSTEARNY